MSEKASSYQNMLVAPVRIYVTFLRLQSYFTILTLQSRRNNEVTKWQCTFGKMVGGTKTILLAMDAKVDKRIREAFILLSGR